MKRPISEVSNMFMVHPANLLVYLVELLVPIEECWPDIDDSWLQALKGKDWGKFGSKLVSIEKSSVAIGRLTVDTLSSTTLRILDKLHRKRYWGCATVPLQAIRNHYCQGTSDFEEALEGLKYLDYLKIDNRGKDVSLNPHKKGEIEEIVKNLRRKH